MIVEYVQFQYPPGMTREQILEDARTTIARWQANTELIRKHYIVNEDGTGATPTIRYFDLLMILDNDAGTVTEYPPNVMADAVE